MAAPGGGGFGRGGRSRGAVFDPGFQPGFNPGRGGRGGGRGFGPNQGRGGYIEFNNNGARNSGAHFYGGSRNHGADRGYGRRRGYGGWHSNNYPNPNFPNPHHPHGGYGGPRFFGGHQIGGGQPQPQQGGRCQQSQQRVGFQQPAGYVATNAGGAPLPAPGSHPPGTQQATAPSNVQGGAVQGAITGQGGLGGLPDPLGLHLQPTQEVGAGQGGGPATNQGTDMVIDTTSTTAKAPLAANLNVPPANQQGTNLDVPESSVRGSQKSKGKPYCWRCRTNGHTIHECSMVLCCELCFGDHVTKVCPFNKKSAATSGTLCGYAVQGLGFYFIPAVANPRVNSLETKALVRVLEGSFSVNQLAVELEKFQPDKNHNWDIQTTGTGAFIINFPSAELLNHVVNWGPMSAKRVQGKIQFEKGTESEVNKWEIDKVWVQIRGLPNEFKEFPIIWAVGTILGVPRAVDTIFTKNTGRPRMKVAVLDPKLIPTFMDVVIGDFIYELQFAVEVESLTGEPQLMDMDYTNEEEPKEDDLKNNEQPKGAKSAEQMDVDGKTTKSQTPATGSGAPPPSTAQQHGALQLEGAGGHTNAQDKAVKPSSKPKVVLQQSSGALGDNGTWTATVLPTQNDSGTILKNTVGGHRLQ